MKYTLKPTTQFKRDLKKAQKQNKNLDLLNKVLQQLADGIPLPEKNRDHALTGNYAGCRECHIQPDWLLIYEIAEDTLFLYLTRTGSHNELFER
ncbi:MAG: type II toxin-antitoxin system YafQ family toxin [Ruminococcus sp.]|jgi:mRNA interferase YafQ|nr:type II toxin-antitoxin system YafQ family toxin [Ruminococcus sp.]MEE1537494.1 type II toxin-antitoxin system YafQ family toxin [Ruminococcus sp.]